MSQNESMEDQNKDNVVQMPVKNMKRVLHKQHLGQKRASILASVVVFLGVFGFVNHILLEKGSKDSISGGRGIASVGGAQERAYNKEFEAEMIAKIQQSNDISFARKPSSIDQLNYGELKGAYNLKLKEGKIQSIELSEAIQRADARYKRSALDFLLQHSNHLPVRFNRVDKMKQEIKDGVVSESFSLHWNQESVGEVDFVHNDKGALVSVHVRN